MLMLFLLAYTKVIGRGLGDRHLFMLFFLMITAQSTCTGAAAAVAGAAAECQCAR